jgi:opacity protein-like surface antigen
MKNLYLLILYITIFLASSSAQANDSGFYIRADAGMAFYKNSTLDLINPVGRQTSPVYFGKESAFSAGLGYKSSSALRSDITFSRRILEGNIQPTIPSGLVAKFKLDSYITMLNLYIDGNNILKLNENKNPYIQKINPYIMGGIGWAYHDMSMIDVFQSGIPLGTTSGDGYNNYAWKIGLGVDYPLTENIKIDLGYHHLDLGETKTRTSSTGIGGDLFRSDTISLSSKEILLGLRYTF